MLIRATITYVMTRRALCLITTLVLLLPASAIAAEAVVRVLHFDGIIHPASAHAFGRAIEQAAADDAALLLVEVNTPGGLVASTKDIVGKILDSKVPVCVYVTPRAAQAASGGFFLLLAADVAAMAPVTTTGAAHPVLSGGENSEGDVLLKKISEDLAALVRSAAKVRGRPAELAEQAVREAKAWNAEEALDAGLIDVVAQDREDLLAWLDGREIIRPDGRKQRLALTDARIVEHRYDWEEEFKNVLLHPWVMATLLSIGMLAIYIELNHPGLILPGVVGAVCLLIFLWGSQMLPVNFFAVALIALAMVMFILELKVVSHGMLTVGGGVALAVGLFMLFPRSIPALAISLYALTPILVFVLVVVAFVSFFVVKAQRLPVTTGREGMLSLRGKVTRTIDPNGTVYLHGEYWNARAAVRLEKGESIRVVAVDGLVLEVERGDRVAEGDSTPTAEGS